MNLIKLITSAFKTLCMVYAIVGGVSTAYAGDDNCWAEFFQHRLSGTPFPACRSDTVGQFTRYQW